MQDETHWPASHVSVEEQLLSHPPQWAGSTLVSTHPSPHSSRPLGHSLEPPAPPPPVASPPVPPPPVAPPLDALEAPAAPGPAVSGPSEQPPNKANEPMTNHAAQRQ
jgi:hypothetical protein